MFLFTKYFCLSTNLFDQPCMYYFSYPHIQGNPVPNTLDQEFVFRLSEHPDYQWTPRLTAFEFITMLSNLTAIKIRGVYNPGGKSHSLIIHSSITRIHQLVTRKTAMLICYFWSLGVLDRVSNFGHGFQYLCPYNTFGIVS